MLKKTGLLRQVITEVSANSKIKLMSKSRDRTLDVTKDMLRCGRCSSIVHRKLLHHLTDEYATPDVPSDDDSNFVCRKCYKSTINTVTAICPRCLVEKPLDKSHFYKKVRGQGYMRICRICRERQLVQNRQRICGACWGVFKIDRFSDEEWNKERENLAFCLSCMNQPRRKKKEMPSPRLGERVCPRCQTSKNIDQFHVGLSRISPYCRPCTQDYNRVRYQRKARPRRISGTITRTVRNLYALETMFSPQELVDKWAKNETVEIPHVDIPGVATTSTSTPKPPAPASRSASQGLDHSRTNGSANKTAKRKGGSITIRLRRGGKTQ